MEETISNPENLENPKTEELIVLNPTLQDDAITDDFKEEEEEEELIADEDYSELNKDEILVKAKSLMYEENLNKAFNTFSALTSAFDNIEKIELPGLVKQWVDLGNEPKDFKRQPDVLRIELNKAILDFKKKRREEQQRRVDERMANFNIKSSLLNDMREQLELEETKEGLANFKHSMNLWKQVRQVPFEFKEELDKSYVALVQQFYDSRKFHQDLFEIDRQKNLDDKIDLIMKVDALKSESNVRKSLIMLKQYREDWKIIGPVKKEDSDDLWLRFQKTAQEVYDLKSNLIADQNEERESNLKLKVVLTEKAELTVQSIPDNAKGWAELQVKIDALMEEWKTIGPVPIKNSQDIWDKFNGFRTEFFTKRRDFFKTLNSRKEDNLAKKVELCVQAETLKVSTDWKATGDKLQALQEQWKTVGPVPEKDNDVVWKRFRESFDFYYQAKKVFFDSRRTDEAGAVEKRQALIIELKALVGLDNASEVLPKVKEIQKQWNDCGFVSGKMNNQTYTEFKELCDEIYGKFRTEGQRYRSNQIRENINQIASQPDAEFKLGQEQRKLRDVLNKINEEISTLENNKLFFAKSKNAQEVISQFDKQIISLQDRCKNIEKELHLMKSVKPKNGE